METDKTIGKELREIAPVLASFQKPETQAVSGVYFSSVKEKVLAKIRQEDVIRELQSLVPALSVLPKKQSQSVPANYFEHLPNKVLATVQTQGKRAKTQENSNFLERIFAWLEHIFAAPKLQAAVAVIVVTAVLSGVYVSFEKETKNTQMLAAAKSKITKEDIQSYVLENSDEFDELTLEENLNEKKGV